MAHMPFKSLFCEKYKCSPEDYEERAFRMTLYWHARLLAPVIRLVWPAFFEEDLKFIRYLAEAIDARQAKVDVLDFKDSDRKNWRLLHSGLRIRVSHRKARRIAFQIFGELRQPADAAWRSLK